VKSWMLRCGAGLIASLQPVWAGVTTTCPAGGVTITAQSTRLPGALTSVDLAMLTSSPQAGPDLFQLGLHPAPAFHGDVSVRIEIKSIPSDPGLSCPDPYSMVGVGQGCWLQRETIPNMRLTGVEATADGMWSGTHRGTRWFSASHLARLPKQMDGDISAPTSPLRDLVARLGSVPAGQIHFRFSVLCDGKELSSTTLKGDYWPVERPTLLMPGRPVKTGFQEIGSLSPTFVWNGSLTGLNLAPSAPYRLSVWEVPNGVSVEEATSRLASRSLTTAQSMSSWPSTWSLLEPGKRYVWRVDALKRGIADEWLSSEVFGFTPKDGALTLQSGAHGGSAEQSELSRLLLALAGPHRAKVEPVLRTDLPDPYSLRMDGKIIDLARLRELVRELQVQKISVESVESSR